MLPSASNQHPIIRTTTGPRNSTSIIFPVLPAVIISIDSGFGSSFIHLSHASYQVTLTPSRQCPNPSTCMSSRKVSRRSHSSSVHGSEPMFSRTEQTHPIPRALTVETQLQAILPIILSTVRKSHDITISICGSSRFGEMFSLYLFDQHLKPSLLALHRPHSPSPRTAECDQAQA
jgi:hypothetical protein